VDDRDARVANGARGARFTQQALAIFVALALQELERDRFSRDLVLRGPHLTHAAFAEDAIEPIFSADERAGGQCHGAGIASSIVMRDPTERFSDRVADYVRHRPGYPEEIVRILERDAGISASRTRIADVGAGTGISALLFAKHGYAVTAVEPNDAMRAECDRALAGNAKYRSVSGTAEETTLDSGSIDLVVAAQAFHWFDRSRARVELARILAPGGIALLVWNDRRVDTPFLREYEDALMRLGIDYAKVRHQNISDEAIRAWFRDPCTHTSVPNHQDFDREGLIGRALSSSYVPKKGQPNHDELMSELERIFTLYAANGVVRFAYDTQLWFGPLPPL
jgi:SAM-dependent methyltransferase